jgi:hypothetical protein
MEFQNPLAAAIVTFLLKIGIEVSSEPITAATVLPGVDVRHGTLIVDESRLKHPGDLLHEAGHIAVIPSERRKRLHGNVGQRAYEEMMAIAWSYAAALHLGIDPAVVFHEDGYRGGSRAIIENFSNGRYFGVSTLEWVGLTTEKMRAGATGAELYPKMIKWMLD